MATVEVCGRQGMGSIVGSKKFMHYESCKLPDGPIDALNECDQQAFSKHFYTVEDTEHNPSYIL